MLATIAGSSLLVVRQDAATNLRDNNSKKEKIRLQFRKEKGIGGNGDVATFTVLQLTDMHLGEAENLDWGPEADRKTFGVLESVLDYEDESTIDFVVVTGDQLTANNIDDNATDYYRMVGDFLQSRSIPYAMIFGNHDDAPLDNDPPDSQPTEVLPAKANRTQLVLTDQTHSFSLSEVGPSSLYGVSNFVLPVWGSSATDPQMLQIFLLDSGGGSLPTRVDRSHLDWFRSQRTTTTTTAAVVFQHVPTKQFRFNKDRCAGFNGDNGIDPVLEDAGLVQTLQDDGNVHFLAVGHMHGNSYCCSTTDGNNKNNNKNETLLHLCFGRHSGYGGYGSSDRGGRLYQFRHEQNQLRWRSWVRLESGETVDRYDSP